MIPMPTFHARAAEKYAAIARSLVVYRLTVYQILEEGKAFELGAIDHYV